MFTGLGDRSRPGSRDRCQQVGMSEVSSVCTISLARAGRPNRARASTAYLGERIETANACARITHAGAHRLSVWIPRSGSSTVITIRWWSPGLPIQ